MPVRTDASSSLRSQRRVYVLVHGAWHGGWCYQQVARILRDAGHDVYTPTLTGLGERSHLQHDAINLETHITDVMNVILWEELSEVILVGHSYAGMVITGVADRLSDKIAALVYLDAFVPANGESSAVHSPEKLLAAAELAKSDGRTIPPPPPAYFGIRSENRDRVQRLCVPQPFAASLQALQLSGAVDAIANRHYVFALGWDGDWTETSFRIYYERLKNDPSWQVHAFACGHDMMIDLPQETAALLASI